MNKLHLTALALVLSIFMGHAKKGKHGGHHSSHHKQSKHTPTDGGMLTGFGMEVGYMEGTIVAVTSPKHGKFVAIAQNKVAGSGMAHPTYFAGSVARYGMNGKLETFFEEPFHLQQRLPNFYPQAVADDNRNGYIVGYTNEHSYELVRYHADGSIDQMFQFAGNMPQSGKLTAIAVQHDGKVLVGSDSADMPLARYDEHGALDTGFNQAVSESKRGLQKVHAISLAMTKTNKKNVWRVIVAGSAHKENRHMLVPMVMKFDQNGMANQWFNFAEVPADYTNVHFNAVAPYLNSHILLAGSSDQGPLLWRVNGLGELDQAFGDYVTNSTPYRAVNDVEEAQEAQEAQEVQEEPVYRLYGARPSASQMTDVGTMVSAENQTWDLYGSMANQGGLPGFMHAVATNNHGMHGANHGMVQGMMLKARGSYNAVIVDEHDNIIVAGHCDGSHFVLRRYNKQGMLDHKGFGANGTVRLYNGNAHALVAGENKTMLVAGKIDTGMAGKAMPVMYNLKV